MRTVGDLGTLTQSLPVFMLPSIPLTFETLAIIFPYALALTVVGQLESLLTASIIDDMTDTESDKNKECRGQGIANIVTGCFGGMAGCAMIGQSVINVKSGGNGRLSSLVAGVALMILIIALGGIVVQIPMAALAGVMIMVAIGTFDWSSLANIHKVPKTDSTVMVVTVATVVVTHDLAKGVLAGVILSAIFFVSKISKIHVEEKLVKVQQKKVYSLKGQLFFASVSDLPKKFRYDDKVKEVEIDLSAAHLWDDSAINALDKIENKFEQQDIKVTYAGLNPESKQLLNKIGGLTKASGH